MQWIILAASFRHSVCRRHYVVYAVSSELTTSSSETTRFPHSHTCRKDSNWKTRNCTHSCETPHVHDAFCSCHLNNLFAPNVGSPTAASCFLFQYLFHLTSALCWLAVLPDWQRLTANIAAADICFCTDVVLVIQRTYFKLHVNWNVPFPQSVIIAHGNRLLCTLEDAVNADLLYTGSGLESHTPQESP